MANDSDSLRFEIAKVFAISAYDPAIIGLSTAVINNYLENPDCGILSIKGTKPDKEWVLNASNKLMSLDINESVVIFQKYPSGTVNSSEKEDSHETEQEAKRKDPFSKNKPKQPKYSEMDDVHSKEIKPAGAAAMESGKKSTEDENEEDEEEATASAHLAAAEIKKVMAAQKEAEKIANNKAITAAILAAKKLAKLKGTVGEENVIISLPYEVLIHCSVCGKKTASMNFWISESNVLNSLCARKTEPDAICMTKKAHYYGKSQK